MTQNSEKTNSENPSGKVLIFDLHETFSTIVTEILKVYGIVDVQWISQIEMAKVAVESIEYDWILIASEKDINQLIDHTRSTALNQSTPIQVLLPTALPTASTVKVNQDSLTKLKLLEDPTDLAIIIHQFYRPEDKL